MKCSWSGGCEKRLCFILGVLKDQNPFSTNQLRHILISQTLKSGEFLQGGPGQMIPLHSCSFQQTNPNFMSKNPSQNVSSHTCWAVFGH